MPVRSPSYCEGGAEARAEIRDFLRRRQKSLENEEVLEITLCESSKGQEGDPIEEYKLGFDDDQLDNIAREIVTDAEKNALVLRGRVKFKVKIAGYSPTLTFGLDVVRADDLNDELDDDDDLDDLERPDKKGLVGMAMRHAEVSHKEMRAASRSIRETMRDLRVQLRESQEENRELRQTLRQQFRMEQELHNMDYLRRRDMRREEKAEERKDKLIAGVEKLLPAAGAKLLGMPPEVMAQMVQPPAVDSQQSTVNGQPSTGNGQAGWTAIEQRSLSIIEHLQRLDEEKQGVLLRTLPGELLLEIQALHQEVTQKKASSGQSTVNSNSGQSTVNGQTGAAGRNGAASAYG
jgi:hypothetical protein